MDRIPMGDRSCGLGRVGLSLFQGVALALMLAIAMPAWAVDERAVKSR